MLSDQEPAGDAAGLAASLAAGLASVEAIGAGLSSGAADAEASGAEVSSDLLQAMTVAAKNIEMRPRIRNLRIITSFGSNQSGISQTALEYFRSCVKTRLQLLVTNLTLRADKVVCNYRA
jgi:hypothetical protein